MSSHVDTADFEGTESLAAYVDSRSEPKWIGDLRRAALSRFQELDWPTTQDEEWRRSDISYYDFDSYRYAAAADVVDSAVTDEAAEAGVEILPLGAFFARLDEQSDREGSSELRQRVLAALARDVDGIEHRFQAWHYAAFTTGVAITVPEGVMLREPIRLGFTVEGDERMVAPHVLVMANRGSSVRVVRTVTGQEEGEVLYNEGATLVLEDGASVDYQSYYDLNIDSLVFTNDFAYVGRDAALRHFTGAFGGMFAKHRTDAHVLGTGADAQLRGLYFAREDQHMDLRTVQYHEVGNGTSRTFYKGAVQDEGRTVYQGLIEVDGGADKTDAYLTNNNLILNDGARADSIPSLQIRTDDVKCSHGSTTGKIDPTNLHYVQTRGYSPLQAKQIIVEGYFEEIAAKLDDVLAERIRAVVHQRLIESEEE